MRCMCPKFTEDTGTGNCRCGHWATSHDPDGHQCTVDVAVPIGHRPGCVDPDHPSGTECDVAPVGFVQGGPVGSSQPIVVPDRVVATVANGGQEVNLREMLTEPWQPALAERLTAVLGRKYLAHQLVSMLPADVAVRLVDRVAEVVEHQVSAAVEQIHLDVDGAVTTTLARLAEAADAKRRELSRERFTGHSRLG